MDVLVGMQHSLSLEHLRATGPQADERMQPEDAPTPRPPPAAAAAPAREEPSPAIVTELSAVMPGFSVHAYQRAALGVGNSDSNSAMNWLLNHTDDADINEPLPAAGGGGSGGGECAPAKDSDGAAVAQLTDMGFTEKQVRCPSAARGRSDSDEPIRAQWTSMCAARALSARIDRVTLTWAL